MQSFGVLLKRFRRLKGNSQESLADTLGVHRNSISDWERDNYLPRSRQMVLDLAESLTLNQTNTDQLLRAAEYPLEYNLQEDMIALFNDIQAEYVIENVPDEPKEGEFVGRDNELAQLNRLIDNILTKRQGGVAFVKGEAGSGKTALVQEFARIAMRSHQDLVVAGGCCNAYVGVGDPYLPFREILGILTCNMEVRWSINSFERQFTDRLRNLTPLSIKALIQNGQDLIDTFMPGPTLLSSAASMQENTPWIDKLKALIASKATDQFPNYNQQKNLFEQYTRMLQVLAHEKPIVLVLDDLQWVDIGSIGLLFHLGKRLRNCRILVLGIYRPADVALGRNNERHPLEQVINEFQLYYGNSPIELDHATSEQFVDSILNLESNKLSLQFRNALFQYTKGHALFTIETIRNMQRNESLLKDEDGRWFEGPNLDWQTLPERVDGIIRERIERLPEQLKSILKIACIEGEEFHAEVVASILDLDVWEVTKQLSGILDKQHHLVTGMESFRFGTSRLSHYRFRHILFQIFLYNNLDSVEKVYLHEMVGNTLERLYLDRTGTIAVKLARHFKEAQLYNEAIHYLIQAGKCAIRMSANEDALTHLNDALELLPMCPNSQEIAAQELELQISLGIALIAIKGNASQTVESVYLRARKLAEDTGEKFYIFQTISGLWSCYFARAELAKALELGKELLDNAQSEQNTLVYLHAYGTLGPTLCVMGEFSAAIDHCTEGSSLYNSQHEPFNDNSVNSNCPGVGYPAYAALALWALGFPDQSLGKSRRSIELAEKLGRPLDMSFAYGMSGFLHLLRQEEDDVKRHAAETLRIATKYGFGQWIVLGTILYSWSSYKLGRNIEDVNTMQKALDSWHAAGGKLGTPYFLMLLAEAYYETGQLETGMATLKKALTLNQASEERWLSAEIFRIQGELILANEGSEKEAEAAYQQSLRTALSLNAKSWELRTIISICRLRLCQNRVADVLQRLTRTYGWFKEGFDSPDLSYANTLQNEMNHLISAN